MMCENNIVNLAGIIASDFTFSHEMYGEKFYSTTVKAKRLSETDDLVPVIVSERLIDVSEDLTGSGVFITGELRTHNHHEEAGTKVIIYVFVNEIQLYNYVSCKDDENSVSLSGYICKKPSFRQTPLGREIADLLLAINRPYGKSDYIPCICWGRNAKFTSDLKVGDHIEVKGRVQSRNYNKRLSDTEIIQKTAYEVSVATIY